MKPLSILLLLPAFFFGNRKPQTAPKPSNVVYKTENLYVVRMTDHIYRHVSFLQTESFGKVPCNGMVVVDGNETVVLDTPTDDKSAGELIAWIKTGLHAKVNAVVATHFHNDCLGGLAEFHKNGTPSYASHKTIELAKQNNYTIPKNGFNDSITLAAGSRKVLVRYFGEGHTKDNVVAYVPSEKALFGGCLIKEKGATKGYLGDANVSAWPATVERVKAAYPDVKIVVPGHGKPGGKELLHYTVKLFKNG